MGTLQISHSAWFGKWAIRDRGRICGGGGGTRLAEVETRSRHAFNAVFMGVDANYALSFDKEWQSVMIMGRIELQIRGFGDMLVWYGTVKDRLVTDQYSTN